MAAYDNPPQAIFAGSDTITDDAAPLNSGGSLPCQEVLVVNLPASTQNVLIGGEDTQPFSLAPGQSIPIPINDVAKVWAATATGSASVEWIVVA